MRVFTKDDLDRRTERVPESGCWLWLGADLHGYGNVRVNNKSLVAHRLSYELYNGPIPDGLHVLHRCDVRPCANPAHLFLGTNQDNILDSVRKGRRKGVTRKRPSGLRYKPMSVEGRQNHMKVKPAQREEIIRLCDSGMTQTAVAAMYGLTQSAVSRLRHA